MKLKMVANLFIGIAMALLVVAFISKFFNTVVLFHNVSPQSHILFANTCLLLALILKLAND